MWGLLSMVIGPKFRAILVHLFAFSFSPRSLLKSRSLSLGCCAAADAATAAAVVAPPVATAPRAAIAQHYPVASLVPGQLKQEDEQLTTLEKVKRGIKHLLSTGFLPARVRPSRAYAKTLDPSRVFRSCVL